MNNTEELKNLILGVLEGEEMSATAISKALGYTKLNARVSNALQILINDGVICKSTHHNGFVVYFLNNSDDEDDEVDEDEVDEDIENKDNNVMPREITGSSISQDNHGYIIESLPKDHVKIIFPEKDENGNDKSIILESYEQLIVINNSPLFRFIVSKPDEILDAIGICTAEMGITTYLVSDTSTGKAISSVKDINKTSIVFLNINRHDKAGK